tara:strand:- start:91050 stop:92561 length:1512 start_codon:yes stop_codon:yes gene_type:complete
MINSISTCLSFILRVSDLDFEPLKKKGLVKNQNRNQGKFDSSVKSCIILNGPKHEGLVGFSGFQESGKGELVKSMNFLEFQGGVDRLRKLIVGAQLQDFSVLEKDLLLLFYASRSFILRISLRTPPVFFLESSTYKLEKKSQKVPLGLFLSKHFLRKSVVDVKYLEHWGRKFEIHLSDESGNPLVMEVILVPGFQNVALSVKALGKTKNVYWNKPRELSEFSEQKAEVADFRSLEVIREEWYAEKIPSDKKVSESVAQTKDVDADWKLEVQKKVRKKTEAIEKIKQQNAENEVSVAMLYKIGELLKYQTANQLSDQHQEWLRQYHPKNIDREQIFKKAKTLAAKKDGMSNRIELLLKEIGELTSSLDGPPPQPKHKISAISKGDVDTRKFEVNPNVSLYMGKNAKDNVELLKSSQPWELWFHLKDYPSAYAITRRNKSVTVGHAELVKMAAWFAKECFKNQKEKSPQHIEVIYTECRFVKLLKGDKLGRVTHTNTKTLRVSTT